MLGRYLRWGIVVLAACWLVPVGGFAEGDFAVGVVPSDDGGLASSVGRDQELSADQVLDMVRRAVDLVGGMAAVVPDTARLVAIKPNISIIMEPESGVVTDPRVVRAVAILVREVAPQARLLIVEGPGGWVPPEMAEKHGVETSFFGRLLMDMEEDGFEVVGYRAVARELREAGMDIECYDLNFDRARTLEVPGGSMAMPDYDIATTVLEADAWINCPVTKTHGTKITCAMKNNFGLLPGLVYGFDKSRGTEKHAGIPHDPGMADEMMVDLYLLAQADLHVVDGIVGRQAGGLQFGEPIRTNLVLAGRDAVAVDLVVAQLLGFNPDDMEFAELARRRGRGPGVYENVEIRGGDVEKLKRRFRKAGEAYEFLWFTREDWKAQANYGMGPRYWTLLGPVDEEHQFGADEIAVLDPVPGVGGWSEVVWFGHDKIDLDGHFDDPAHCAVYGFTRFHMPQADSVRYWVGSDEGFQVWIDGGEIYGHAERREHELGMERLPGFLQAGEHRLLIRAQQSRGDFDFSINICEPIDDEYYAGNRYPGLRYFAQR